MKILNIMESILYYRGRLNMYKNILLFGMLSMLFISITIPITYGHNVKIINQMQITENHDKKIKASTDTEIIIYW